MFFVFQWKIAQQLLYSFSNPSEKVRAMNAKKICCLMTVLYYKPYFKNLLHHYTGAATSVLPVQGLWNSALVFSCRFFIIWPQALCHKKFEVETSFCTFVFTCLQTFTNFLLISVFSSVEREKDHNQTFTKRKHAVVWLLVIKTSDSALVFVKGQNELENRHPGEKADKR